MPSIFSKIVDGEIPCHKVAENENFLAFLESLKDFAELRNLSIPPLKSTVLNAELETFNFIFFFRASLLKLTFLILR